VVVADSRQAYARLHIATNHPPDEYRAAVPYHGIELVDPVEGAVSVHDWLQAVLPALEAIATRGRLAVVEGGSMLWVDALTEGFDLAAAPPDPDRRRQLAVLPVERLAERVRELDPAAAVDFANPRRLVRAVEILEAHGPPLAARRGRRGPAAGFRRVGLEAPMSIVERRLRLRCQEQVARGLVEETRAALAAGVPRNHPVLTGIGYAEALAFLEGGVSAPDLPERMLVSNRRYARRQLAWFRRHPDTAWLPAESDPVPAILKLLETAD
jgi:tRNA dimethylallyltransferase